MAKTKRTAKEVEAAVESTVEAAVESTAAAASSASKLITQGGLNHFATRFWDKIKTRYDGTFKKAILTEDKELIFTKTDDSTQKLDLREYARLKDRNEFKQDVSADNVAILSNRHIGSRFETTSHNRSLGFRQLTVNSFSDRYVDHIRIYMPNNINTGTNSTWFVWAIKKGANDNKNEDRVVEVIHNSKNLSVDSITENSTEKKFVKIPVNKSFENDIYFIVRCTTHEVGVVSEIDDKYKKDVVNMNNSQPPLTENSVIDWGNGHNADSNTALMYLFGRESIGTLSLKLNKLNSDSGLYVKQEETTKTGGTEDKANMVVRLGDNGKLNENMLPSIAINEYFKIDQFTHEKLDAIKEQFENGDVVVVIGEGVDKGKRFLCVDKQNNLGNLVDGFVELNSKDGIVKSVNGKIGEVNLELEATANELKLKIKSGNETTDIVETSVDIITNNEIDSIINNLRD